MNIEKYPLVVVYHKNSEPLLHFFDDEETAICFRRDVNTHEDTNVTKALYKGKQPHIIYLSWEEYKEKYKQSLKRGGI